LHPPVLRLLGIVAALEDLAVDFTDDDVSVEFSHRDVPPDVPDEIGLCLFRVAQEALKNAVQHGHATRMRIDLASRDDGVALVIADNGVGFDLTVRGPGLGLLNMDERVRSLAGSCAIHSQAGGGTRIDVTIPNPTAGRSRRA
jgi:signal transduction histidine kinase